MEDITPERIYSAKQRFRVLVRGVDGLTDKQRELILRSRIQGQTYAQISAETGWSNADISRQLKAALAIIRAALDAHDDHDRATDDSGSQA